MDAIHWLVGGLCACGILGVWLNNYKQRSCFLFWMVSNSGFVLVDLGHTHLPERALQHLLFFALAIHGYRQWGPAMGIGKLPSR